MPSGTKYILQPVIIFRAFNDDLFNQDSILNIFCLPNEIGWSRISKIPDNEDDSQPNEFGCLDIQLEKKATRHQRIALLSRKSVCLFLMLMVMVELSTLTTSTTQQLQQLNKIIKNDMRIRHSG